MWEFMTQYAESFWSAGDYAWHVFTVIMAWAITLGFAYLITINIVAIGQMIRDKIQEWREEDKSQG